MQPKSRRVSFVIRASRLDEPLARQAYLDKPLAGQGGRTRKTFDPNKYGMVICPQCDGDGYILQGEERECCPKCGGFGYIKKEPEEDINTSPGIPT